MTILSTIQSMPTEVDTATMYMEQPGVTSHPVTHGTSSITEHGEYETPNISVTDLVHDSRCTITASIGEFMTSTSTGFFADNHMDRQHGEAPADGNTVWYCSNCGDGPIGSWNNVCTACGHAYCGACVVEKTA